MADQGDGVRVISVADPVHPVELGHSDTTGWAWGVAVAGNLVYVAHGYVSDGLRVVSVTDPAHPADIGACMAPDNGYAVAVGGDCAYLAAADSGLRVISVADPRNPVELGYYNCTLARGVAVGGGYAYVAGHVAGLLVCQFLGAGVDENPKHQTASRKSAATVLSGASSAKRLASSVIFDAMGRRVSNPRSGIFFVQERSAASGEPSAVTKIVIQH